MSTIKRQWLGKLSLFIIWPLLGALMMIALILTLAAAWPLIPLSSFKRRDDGTGYRWVFPWE